MSTQVRQAGRARSKNQALPESVFLKACRLEKTSYTPVWLMRQAGRYMKEYRDLRSKVPFTQLCKNSDLAAEITVRAQQKIKADAAIIFSDILLLLEPYGLGLTYSKNDGPLFRETVQSVKQVEKFPNINPTETLAFVLEAIRKTRLSLPPEIPLIGFSGAPFTLASYLIEGGASKNFERTKSLMRSNETLWRVLMEKIAGDVAGYLNAQIDAGVQALQLFDSWVGCLSKEDYVRYVKEYSKQVIDRIQGRVPLIHFGTGTDHFLEEMSEAGGEVIGIDFRMRLDDARKRLGAHKAIQGNLDPAVLLGSQKSIRMGVQTILNQTEGFAGHIFNLGHGVLPETPEENVIALIEMVHQMSRNH